MNNDSINHNGPHLEDGAFDEVLLALQQYLSDMVPPLMLVNEAENLFEVPPALLAGEIQRWVASQYRSGENAPASDYLYHVARKIHQLGDLQIFPEEEFLPFRKMLTTILVELCPMEDREGLIVDLEHLSAGGNIEGAPVHVEHRAGPAETPAGHRGGEGAVRPTGRRRPAPPSEDSRALTAEHVQRLELLLQRLERTATATGGTAGDGTATARAPVVAEAVISAAETSEDSRQLQEFLSTFNVPGLPSSPAELLSVLAERLPDWAPPTGDMDAASPRTVEAMRKVVATAESPAQAGQRYDQLVEMAAKEFNRGSLGRAVTLLDLARRMVEKEEVDESVAARMADRGEELLDAGRLREYAATEGAHALLRRVMTFFSDLSPPVLLGRLEREEHREQRRLTLSLLEAHGAATRPHVLDRLEASIKEGGVLPWYYERNLILLLREIPPAGEEDRDREIDALVWLARPGGPLASVREALTALGSIRHKRAESTLTATVTDLERALTGDLKLPYSREEVGGLLDRAIGALAAMPSRDARRRVVRHALDPRAQFGHAIVRMAPLGQQDLSDDPQLVQYLLDALLNELPMRVFGKAVLTARRSATITSIIQALAGTDTPEVRKALSEVAHRFPGEPFSTEAQRVLASLGGRGAGATEQTATMAGDLDLLSFPNLLQNIADAHLTGTLTLFDTDGATTATLGFADGMLVAARAHHLQGEAAFFQILQAPQAARFVFTRSTSPEFTQASRDRRPILPLLLEGMRRLDEFRCAEAVVPPGAAFKATSKPPSAVPDEKDEALLQKVWEAASTGRTAAQCEAELPVDPYRIRRMYEHWLQEGALAPKA